MPDTGPTSERLEALRARWESDKGSRVFLQLADEYRRLGRVEEAVGVLQEGLAENPRYPAALVALGRSQLEVGRTAEAVEALERVVESDPTQMVAYRLLVEAYVAQGKPDEARERLRVYSLLNDADPEIADLRRRIGELERRGRSDAASGGEEVPAEPQSSPFLEDDEPAAAEEPAVAEVSGSPASNEGAGSSGGAAPLPSEPEHERPRLPPLATPRARDGEPFPDLTDREARRRYLETLEAEGLFELPPAPEREIFDLERSAAAPAPDLSSLLGEPVPGAEAAPAPAPSGEGEDVFVLGEAPPEAEPPRGAAPGADAPPSTLPRPSSEPPAPPPPEPPAETAGRPTVTLGRLYLRQGHRAEAESIFREVLEREPDNEEARRHVEELRAAAEDRPPGAEPAAAPVSAEELLAPWGEAAGEGGLTERKRFVLERYLDRLRGRSSGDVH